MPEMSKALAAAWKALDQAGKAPYTTKSALDKERYNSEMDAYVPLAAFATATAASSSSSAAETKRKAPSSASSAAAPKKPKTAAAARTNKPAKPPAKPKLEPDEIRTRVLGYLRSNLRPCVVRARVLFCAL